MGAIASQITSLTIVYSTVYSDADQRKHQSSASLAFVRGTHRDRWIPRTKGMLRGKCFHLMASSCMRYDNKMRSSQWDNDNQHFVYIIISWYLLGIITRQGFLFSCSCMNRCNCLCFSWQPNRKIKDNYDNTFESRYRNLRWRMQVKKYLLFVSASARWLLCG